LQKFLEDDHVRHNVLLYREEAHWFNKPTA